MMASNDIFPRQTLQTIVLLLGLLITQPSVRADTPDFCFSDDQTSFCPITPTDIPEFSSSFDYRFIAPSVQAPFDRFSWQAFIASQWPLDETGTPISNGFLNPNNGTPRWKTYTNQHDMLATSDQEAACSNQTGLLLSQFRQSSGEALVDSAGNFVLYETRLNPASEAFIRQQRLVTTEERKRYSDSGQEIQFPLQSTGGPGAQMLKFAWKVMTDADNPSDFLVQEAHVSVAARHAHTGQPKCLSVTVGLVGMHLVQRVPSGNGDRWVWSTFEHTDTAPLATNARGPNSIMVAELFPDGCQAPTDTAGRAHLFFDVQSDTRVNTGHAQALWGDRAPYARDSSGLPIQASRIVRCWDIFEGTRATNGQWQQALQGSALAHYRLVGTQWVGNIGGAPFGTGEVPRYLSNVTLESFIQDKPQGTCLGCHNTANTDAGQPANFTFVLNPR